MYSFLIFEAYFWYSGEESNKEKKEDYYYYENIMDGLMDGRYRYKWIVTFRGLPEDCHVHIQEELQI